MSDDASRRADADPVGTWSWIVGASSAIGRAIAVRLASAGDALVLLGRDRPELERTAQRCTSATHLHTIDLTDATCIDELDALRRSHPPRRLIYVAGIFDWSAADTADPAVSAALIDINLGAAVRMTRLVLPDLVALGGGTVAYIASLAGLDIFAHNAAYVASKHGLVAYAKSAFLDVRDRGIKVSVICPGLVDAGASQGLPEQQRMRFLWPDDVADAVQYVISTSARACPTEIRLEPQLDPHRA